jgi:hypothetical protein
VDIFLLLEKYGYKIQDTLDISYCWRSMDTGYTGYPPTVGEVLIF